MFISMLFTVVGIGENDMDRISLFTIVIIVDQLVNNL